MATFKHCARPVEPPATAHEECAGLHGAGWSDAQISAKIDGLGRPAGAFAFQPPRPLNRGDIIIGVFLGNILAGLLLGALFAILSGLK